MPDPKVIGHISNTLDEIRDILAGTKSSKLYNSVQAIASANISIESMMKELVDDVKDTKRITLMQSVSNHSSTSKIKKDVSKELKNISSTLKDISANVLRIAKNSHMNLSNINDRKSIEKLLKDSQKDSRSNKILNMINVVSRLRSVGWKDILFAKRKVNAIESIYGRLVGIFNSFEKNGVSTKEVNKFSNSAIEIVKKLSKIAFLSKLSVMGARAIDKVFFGPGGLIKTMVKMNNHKKDINKAKKISRDMVIISGSLFLVTLMMTGVAVLGIPAMAGALMTSGIMVVFGLTFAFMGVFEKPIKKGSDVMVGVMKSVVLAGVGLWLINKGTKGLSWEQLAMAGVAILGFGSIAAILGVPVVFVLVSLGCIAFALMGLALIAVGGGVAIFGSLVTDKAIDKISYGIPKIFEAMTSIFTGDEKNGNVSFGEGLLGFVTGVLKLGGAIYASGALIVMGISLGILGLTLRSWENFDVKSIDNIEYAITKIDKCFGLGLQENRHSEGGVVGQAIGVYSDVFGFASTLLQCGKTFATMGAVLFTCIVLGLVKSSIDKWKDLDDKSLKNIDTAITKLDDIFSLGIKNKNEASIGGIITGGFKIGANYLERGASILNCGGVMIKMGTLLFAVGVTSVIVNQINKWKGFDPSPLDDVLGAMKKFGEFFGFELGGEKKGAIESITGVIGDAFNVVTSPIQLGATLMNAGKQFATLSTLAIAVGVVDSLVDVMIKAGKNAKNMNGALDTTFDAFDRMIEYFFNDDRLDTSMWDGVKGIGAAALGGLIAGPIGMLGAFLLAPDERKSKLSVLTTSVGIVDRMADAIIKMGKYSGNVDSALETTFKALDKLVNYMFGTPDNTGANALGRIGSAMAQNRLDALRSGDILSAMFGDGSSQINTQLEVLTSCVGIVGTMADALYKMKDLTPSIDTAVDSVFRALERIADYFFGEPGKEASSAMSRVGAAMANAHSQGNLWELMFGDGSSPINTQLEIIVGCVGIVSQVSDVIKTMGDTKDVDKSMNNLFTSLDKIITYFTKYDEDELDNLEDIADEFPDIIESLVEVSNDFKSVEDAIPSIKQFADVAIPSIGTIMKNLSLYTEDYLSGVQGISENLPGIFKNIWRVLEYMNGEYPNSFTNIEKLANTMTSLKIGDTSILYDLGGAFNIVTNGLVNYSKYANVQKIDKLNVLMNKFNKFATINNPFGFRSITRVIDKINTVEIEKAQALTDTFKAFTNINSTGSFFSNFQKQVGLFTEACVRLIDAINGNTDALTSENIMEESQNATPEPSKKSIAISNTRELAATIADALEKNRGFGGGFGESIPVDLKINGQGGDSWVIRKY